jgi:hypothetical protein
MTKRLILGLVAIALFVLIAILPVTAVKVTTGPTYYYNVSPNIGIGAVVFIGEEHLNFTPTGLQIGDNIGYWQPEADRSTTLPTKIVPINSLNDVAITAAEFGVPAGTSNWYYINPSGYGGRYIGQVVDPYLDVAIWDATIASDVTGQKVPIGDDIRFDIMTNQWAALTTNRTPVYNTSTGDGFIDLKVMTPSGAILNALYTNKAASHAVTLTSINVSTQDYSWGRYPLDAAGNGLVGVPTFNWSTFAMTGNQFQYAPGTYRIWAESLLNNMKVSYLNGGGAAYTGKTVSQVRTVTLTKPSLIGVYNSGQWYIDMNHDGTWNGPDKYYGFGAPEWTPVIGDWNGDGRKKIGVYKDGVWYLDWNGNGAWDNGVDKAYNFGAPGWTPVVGDWNNDERDEIGVYNSGVWYLNNNGNGAWTPGIDSAWAFGAPGWTPIVI